MPFLSLPVDVLDRILHELPLAALCHLKCAAKTLKNHARRALQSKRFELDEHNKWVGPLPPSAIRRMVDRWSGGWSSEILQQQTAMVEQIFSAVEAYTIVKNTISPLTERGVARLKAARQDLDKYGSNGTEPWSPEYSKDDRRWEFTSTFQIRSPLGPLVTFAFSMHVEGNPGGRRLQYNAAAMSNEFTLYFLGTGGRHFYPLFDLSFEQYQTEDPGPYWFQPRVVQIIASLLGLPDEGGCVVRKRADAATLHKLRTGDDTFCGWNSEDDLLHALLEIAWCAPLVFPPSSLEELNPKADWTFSKPDGEEVRVSLNAPHLLPPRPDVERDESTWLNEYRWISSGGNASSRIAAYPWPPPYAYYAGGYFCSGFATRYTITLDKDRWVGPDDENSDFGAFAEYNRTGRTTLAALSGQNGQEQEEEENDWEIEDGDWDEANRVFWQNDIAKLHAEGNDAWGRGDYGVSLAKYDSAIFKTQGTNRLLHESLTILFCNRAAVLLISKQYDKALVDANEVIAREPGWAKGFVRRANALHAMCFHPMRWARRWADAEAAYLKALELEPSNEAARTGLAAAKAREFTYAAVIRNYITLPGEVG